MSIPNQEVFVSPPAKSHIPGTAHTLWCSRSWFIFVEWEAEINFAGFFHSSGIWNERCAFKHDSLESRTPPPKKISSNVRRTDNKAQLRRNFTILCQESNAVKFKCKKYVFVYKERERCGCVHIYFIVVLLFDVSSLPSPPEMPSRSCWNIPCLCQGTLLKCLDPTWE